MKHILALWLLAVALLPGTDYVPLHLDGNNDPTPLLAGESLKLPAASGGFFSTFVPSTVASYTITLPPATSTLAASAAALTSGQVPFATTGGLLTNDSSLTYATGSLTVGAGGAATASVKIDGAAGQTRRIQFLSAGSLRWQFNCDNVAEGGANAGSDFQLLARTDAGAAIDSPISIVRAAGGAITFARPTTQATNWTQTGATTVSTGTGTVSLNGDTTIPSAKTLTVASDTDAVTILGRTKLFSTTTDNAMFSHFDHASSTNYAIRQNANGATQLNMATGQTMVFNCNAVENGRIGATGTWGIGTANSTASQLRVGGSSNVATVGTSQRGVYVTNIGQTDATSNIAGYVAGVETIAGSFTCTSVGSFWANDAVIGAGSTATRVYGFRCDALSTGGTANVGYVYGTLTTITAGTWGFYNNSASANYLGTGATLISGTSSIAGVLSGAANTPLLQSNVTGSSSVGAMFGKWSNNATAGGAVMLVKSRGAVGVFTVLANADNIGTVTWNGADGTALIEAATIRTTVDGTPGTNDMPGKLVFSTTADGASSVTDRLTIDNAGVITNTNTTDASAIGTAGVVLTSGLSVAKRSYLGTIGGTFKGNVSAGVQDATAAVAGQVGERISSTVSGVALASTGTVGNITSISLTPGDWDISAFVVLTSGATGFTNASALKMSIVTTTATNGTSGSTMAQESVLALLANGLFTISIPKVATNISATTTHYLTVESTYAAGSPTATGSIIATRVR